MISGINFDQILAKADKCINSSGSRNKQGGVSKKVIAGNPAEKFIEVLQREIHNSEGTNYSDGELGATAVSALDKLEYGAPILAANDLVKIPIWFSEDLSRMSLAPSKYDGVYNIAGLLEKGYKASRSVSGVWEEHTPYPIRSLARRKGSHYIENAVRIFMESYAPEYGVIDVEINDIYN